MISVSYTPFFVKKAKSLERRLFDVAVAKIEKFKNPNNHKSLKVHKLHGRLADMHSFSVNRDIRIVFEYTSKDRVVLHNIGGHSIYN